VYINDAGVKLWGGTRREEFLGRSVLDFVHPRYRDSVERRVRAAQQGATAPLYEQLHVRLDGSTVRVEAIGMPCMYDGRPSVQVILRDVTRRRRAERQVRRQRELLRNFFDHIPVLVGLFGADGRLRMVNRQWRKLLGWGGDLSLDDVISRCFPRAEDRQEAAAFMRSPAPGWRDSRIRLPGGETYDLSCAVLALSDGTRIGIAQDITARKKAETELRRNQAELEQRVRERTDELTRRNEQLRTEIAERRKAELQLQEKQRVLEQLLDMHERYRQLLAYEIHDTFVQDVVGALMFLEVFCDQQSETPQGAPAPVEQARKLLGRSIGAARRVISGLRPPIIDERGFIAAVEYLVSELNAGGMDIRLEHDVRQERFAPVLENGLFRIVQEALTNVERHSGTSFAQVRLVQSGDVLRLTIRDFGRGFDPEQVGPGHFGLQGMNERARLFGGSFRLTSSPGQGTEITVEIPLPRAAEQPSASAG
jgi:PAS domain S-box-containing protein